VTDPAKTVFWSRSNAGSCKLFPDS
jgi:hypothetical protein